MVSFALGSLHDFLGCLPVFDAELHEPESDRDGDRVSPGHERELDTVLTPGHAESATDRDIVGRHTGVPDARERMTSTPQ